eukprot:133941-Chlamydomonas_euryale.AAC.5
MAKVWQKGPTARHVQQHRRSRGCRTEQRRCAPPHSTSVRAARRHAQARRPLRCASVAAPGSTPLRQARGTPRAPLPGKTSPRAGGAAQHMKSPRLPPTLHHLRGQESLRSRRGHLRRRQPRRPRRPRAAHLPLPHAPAPGSDAARAPACVASQTSRAFPAHCRTCRRRLRCLLRRGRRRHCCTVRQCSEAAGLACRALRTQSPLPGGRMRAGRPQMATAAAEARRRWPRCCRRHRRRRPAGALAAAPGSVAMRAAPRRQRPTQLLRARGARRWRCRVARLRGWRSAAPRPYRHGRAGAARRARGRVRRAACVVHGRLPRGHAGHAGDRGLGAGAACC